MMIYYIPNPYGCAINRKIYHGLGATYGQHFNHKIKGICNGLKKFL